MIALRTAVLTGSRHATIKHEQVIERAWREVVKAHNIDLTVHGGALGADYLVARLCDKFRAGVACVPARWEEGPSAGPARNRRMLDTFRPILVLAFPLRGFPNKGTNSCIHEARLRNIPVITVELEP